MIKTYGIPFLKRGYGVLDVAGGKGGVFTATKGLTNKHGKDRVFNSPLAESSIAGVALGAALNGIRPIAEIQFADFVGLQLIKLLEKHLRFIMEHSANLMLPWL